MPRMEMIAEIRDGLQALLDAGRFAVFHEILGDLDRFNLSGVPDATLRQLSLEIAAALATGDE